MIAAAIGLGAFVLGLLVGLFGGERLYIAGVRDSLRARLLRPAVFGHLEFLEGEVRHYLQREAAEAAAECETTHPGDRK